MTPVDEYLEMRKEAGLKEMAKGFGQGLIGGVKPFAATSGNMVNLSNTGAFANKLLAGAERGYELGQKAQIPLAAGAVAGLALVVRKVHGAMTKQRDFKQMMELNPQLAEAQAQRPEMFNAAYNSLRKMNPTFGSDPVVSGAFMHKMMILNPEQAGMILSESAGMKTPAKRGLKLGPLEIK